MSDSTIFVIRNDENNESDRALAADYLARLKDAAKKGSNVMTRESNPFGKLDRTHVEIAEVPKAKVADHQTQGFTQA